MAVLGLMLNRVKRPFASPVEIKHVESRQMLGVLPRPIRVALTGCNHKSYVMKALMYHEQSDE